MTARDHVKLDVLCEVLQADIKKASEHARLGLDIPLDDETQFNAWQKEHGVLAVLCQEHCAEFQALCDRLLATRKVVH